MRRERKSGRYPKLREAVAALEPSETIARAPSFVRADWPDWMKDPRLLPKRPPRRETR
jgi:hypothetical protein